MLVCLLPLGNAVGPWPAPGPGAASRFQQTGPWFHTAGRLLSRRHQARHGTVQPPAPNVQANLDVCTGRNLDVRTGERLYECLMCVVVTYAILIMSTFGVLSTFGRSRFVRLPAGSGRAKRHLASLGAPDTFSLGRAEYP